MEKIVDLMEQQTWMNAHLGKIFYFLLYLPAFFVTNAN